MNTIGKILLAFPMQGWDTATLTINKCKLQNKSVELYKRMSNIIIYHIFVLSSNPQTETKVKIRYVT